VAGIFCGNQPDLAQHAQGAQRDILQITDWRGDKKERTQKLPPPLHDAKFGTPVG
jgi:hypothetical protein